MVSVNLIIALGLLIAFIVAAPKIKGILAEVSNGGVNGNMDESGALVEIINNQMKTMGGTFGTGVTTNGRKIGAVVGGGTDRQGTFKLIKTDGISKVRT